MQEEQENEVGADPSREIETISDEEKHLRGGKPVMKPKRRAESSPFEKEVDLIGKFSLAIMKKPGIGCINGASQVLLDEFKIQEDVQLYIQLHEYEDPRRFDLANGADL